MIIFFLADICKNYQNLTDAERKYDYVTGQYVTIHSMAGIASKELQAQKW